MPDDTRSRILQVAFELFASRGYHATAVQKIAESLGVTKAAVLYHFPSKKDIIAALADPLLTDIETAVHAADRVDDPQRKRWVVIEGLLDAWLRHRHLLQIQLSDLALGSDNRLFARFRDAAIRAEAVIAGPDADLEGRIRAIQVFAVLSDPVVMLPDHPSETLRSAVLAGAQRLLGENAPVEPATVRTGKRTRKGRPAAMSQDMIDTARQLYSSGEYNADDIAAQLGVSRATVYRHLDGS